MFYNLTESVKAHIDMDIGIFIIEEIYGNYEFDLLDCFSVVFSHFVPSWYICSREAYLWHSP